jgi:hypothetical protein
MKNFVSSLQTKMLVAEPVIELQVGANIQYIFQSLLSYRDLAQHCRSCVTDDATQSPSVSQQQELDESNQNEKNKPYD